MAAETPQDAGEVERRERAERAQRVESWSVAIFGEPVTARERHATRAAIELADREHADLVKRAEDAEARLSAVVHQCEVWMGYERLAHQAFTIREIAETGRPDAGAPAPWES